MAGLEQRVKTLEGKVATIEQIGAKKLQRRRVSETAPTGGQVWAWNSTTKKLEPSTNPGGTYHQLISAVHTDTSGTPASGKFARHNGTAWVPTTLVDADYPNAVLRDGTRALTAAWYIGAYNLILPNNVALQIKDSGGTARDILIGNGSDNLFLKLLADGKALYVARDLANAEVALFGGDGADGVKEVYIDASGTTAVSLTHDAPSIYHRAAIWDGAANAFINFKTYIDARTSGAQAIREATGYMKFGTFGSEVDFLRWVMDAGQLYRLELYQDLKMSSADIDLNGNYLRDSAGNIYLQPAASGNYIYIDQGQLYVVSNGATFVNAWWNASDGGTGAMMQLIRSRGTVAAPTAVLNTNVLGGIDFYGYDDAPDTGMGARILCKAAQAWVAGAHGAKIEFYTVPNNGTTATLRAYFGQGGTLFLKELSAAEAAVAAYGQIWVKSETPNKLYFTDDAGTDFQITTATDLTTHAALTTGTHGAGANTLLHTGNASWIDLTDSGTTTLHTHAGKDAQESYGITVEDPTSTEDLSVGFTNRAITVTEMRAVLVGSSTPSVTWTIRHSTDRSAAGNEVVTGGTTTTSTTTGSDVTAFNDATIPADSFIWLETTAKSGTVDELHVTIKASVD